jgi:flagellar assembly protein FliH
MSYRNSLLLFADDFDAVAPPPAAAAEPPPAEPPPPTYGQPDIDAARAEAQAEGYARGIADAAAAEAVRAAAALARIADLLAEAAAGAATVAEDSAQVIVRLLMAAVVAGYPNLRTRYGAEELRALVRRTLPGLLQEQRVTFHVHPTMLPEVGAELATVPYGERQHMTIEPSEAIPPGDARITWPHGAAVRDTTQTAAAIAEILGPLGLLPDPPGDAAVAEQR